MGGEEEGHYVVGFLNAAGFWAAVCLPGIFLTYDTASMNNGGPAQWKGQVAAVTAKSRRAKSEVCYLGPLD